MTMRRIAFSLPGANLPAPNFLALDDDNVRTSEVRGIEIINVSGTGIVQIGDRAESSSLIRGLAVMRQEDHPYAGDVFFESYLIFARPIPDIVDANDPDSIVETYRLNACPAITVGCINLIGVGASSQLVIGRGLTHRAESRIKDIRQFADRRPLPPACP